MAKKAGAKWEALRKSLPLLPPDPTHADVVAAYRDEAEGRTIAELGKDLEAVRAELDALEDEVSQKTARRAAIEAVLAERLEGEGLTSVNTGRWTFTIGRTPLAQVADRDALRRWCVAHAPELLSVNYQTLQSEAKERIENGLALPDGVAVEHAKPTFSRRKAGGE